MNSQAKAAWSAGLTVVLTAIGGALVSLEPTSWLLWLAAGSAVLSSALLTALQASSANQHGGTDRPRRGWLRRLTAATATLLALTVVSIPAALALDGSLDLGHDSPPFPSTTFTPATTTPSTTIETTTETTTTETTTTTPSSTTETSTSPSAAESRLTSAQQELYDRINGEGIDWSTCEGHPNGEDIAGVSAAIQCDNTDPQLDLKIGIMQFRSAGTADGWLVGRAQQVDNPGECSYGQEESTTWNTSGTVRGPMICIDTRVREHDYWSIIWGFRGTGVVMQIFDSSADRAYQWWNSHAGLDVS